MAVFKDTLGKDFLEKYNGVELFKEFTPKVAKLPSLVQALLQQEGRRCGGYSHKARALHPRGSRRPRKSLQRALRGQIIRK